jgi:hypothetical protein
MKKKEINFTDHDILNHLSEDVGLYRWTKLIFFRKKDALFALSFFFAVLERRNRTKYLFCLFKIIFVFYNIYVFLGKYR